MLRHRQLVHKVGRNVAERASAITDTTVDNLIAVTPSALERDYKGTHLTPVIERSRKVAGHNGPLVPKVHANARRSRINWRAKGTKSCK